MADISIGPGTKTPPIPNKAEAAPVRVAAEIAEASPVAQNLAKVTQDSGQERGSTKEKDSSPDNEALAMSAWTKNTNAQVAEFAS